MDDTRVTDEAGGDRDQALLKAIGAYTKALREPRLSMDAAGVKTGTSKSTVARCDYGQTQSNILFMLRYMALIEGDWEDLAALEAMEHPTPEAGEELARRRMALSLGRAGGDHRPDSPLNELIFQLARDARADETLIPALGGWLDGRRSRR